MREVGLVRSGGRRDAVRPERTESKDDWHPASPFILRPGSGRTAADAYLPESGEDAVIIASAVAIPIPACRFLHHLHRCHYRHWPTGTGGSGMAVSLPPPSFSGSGGALPALGAAPAFPAAGEWDIGVPIAWVSWPPPPAIRCHHRPLKIGDHREALDCRSIALAMSSQTGAGVISRECAK